MQKKTSKIVSFFLALAVIITCMFESTVPTYAAQESKNNPVTSISATYTGGNMIVGKTVKKDSFTVIGTKQDKTKEELSNYKIINPKITSTSQDVKISYKSKTGERLTTSVNVKAIVDFKKIEVSLRDKIDLDYGSNITKDMFNVKAILSNGTKKTLSNDSFSLSTSKFDSTSTKMSVSVSATNADGSTLKKTVKLTANKAVTKIKAVFNGEDKDANDALEKSDFEVTGTTVDHKTVTITNFDIDNPLLEKEKNSVKILYTNSFGKTLKSSLSVPANKVVTRILTASYVGGEKNVGDTLQLSDFAVTGQNVKKETVDITTFEISPDTIERENSTVKISYLNSVGKTLTKSVKVSGNNNLESINATRKNNKDLYVGDKIKASDFEVIGMYHDGTSKKLSSSYISIDKDTVTNANDVITVTYTDPKTKNTLTTTVTLDSQDTTTTDGTQAIYIGCQKAVGDTVTETDFKVTVTNTSGATEEAKDIKITSGKKLDSSVNTVTISYTCTNGDKGTVTCTVYAGDDIVDIEVSDGDSVNAYGENSTISSSNIQKVISVYFVYKSGEKQKVNNFKSVGIKVYAVNGGQELTGTGKLTLSKNANSNTISVKYKDLSKTYNIDPDFVKVTQKIKASRTSISMTAGQSTYISKLISGKDPAAPLIINSNNNSIVVNNGDGSVMAKKAGTAKLTVYAGFATDSYGKRIGKSNTITITVKVTAHAQKKNSVTASNITLKVRSSKAISSIAKAKTSLTAISSNKSIVTISGGKLVAKKAGTVKVTIYAAETIDYKGASKTITVTVKK